MKNIKEIAAICLIFCLFITFLPTAAAAKNGLSYFKSDKEIHFTDVTRADWCFADISRVAALGLMEGTGYGNFSPGEHITQAEAVTLCARVHCIYTTGSLAALSKAADGKWFAPFYEYAKAQGLPVGTPQDADRAASRLFVSLLFASCLKAQDLKEINVIAALPDVSGADAERILPLYRAGVLTGRDGRGSLAPKRKITRAETAAIAARLVTPSLRKRCGFAASGKGDMAHFAPTRDYKKQFGDVQKKNWFYKNVKICYEFSLMEGEGKGRFSPQDPVTYAEVAALSARFHCVYLTGSTAQLDAFPRGEAWYSHYYEYLAATGMLPERFYTDPEAPAGREYAFCMLGMMSGALVKINKISSLPDYAGTYKKEILNLYRVGALGGSDAYGSFLPGEQVQRCEIAAVLSRLAKSSLRKTHHFLNAEATWFTYGKSGKGRTLGGYKIGEGKKALVLTFVLHGWEDNWKADGWVLTGVAEALKEYLDGRGDRLGEYTVYILPMCNPDGLMEGSSHNGPGRTTVMSYDSAGRLVNRGVDINRSFPAGYQKTEKDRYYNAPAPLSCPEAVALKTVIDEIAEKHSSRVFIDVHGWYNQIISGEPMLQDIFCTAFPSVAVDTLGRGHGFAAAYAREKGYRAGVFEFPHAESAAAFERSGNRERFINAICLLLSKY